VHLSSGDLLRDERKKDTEDAKIINDHIDKGLMVPGDLVINLVKKAMKDAGWASKKFLIDGFPRNEENCEGWKRVMGDEAQVECVLYLNCPEATMVERVVGRAKDAGAGARKDDTAECMVMRYQVFMKDSEPIVEKYRKLNMVKEIDASYNAKQVFDYVKVALGLSQHPMHIPIPPAAANEYREMAWGIEKYGDKFKPLWINKPKCGDKYVRFDIKYSGICHSDCHLGNNDLNDSIYPMVPGHELIGVVTEVGKDVTKFKIGDNVGVGVIKDLCLKCDYCKRGEVYCREGN
jgi:UMP-CMP kinase